MLTLWFRRASDRGYLRVRDGIADVLADLARRASPGVRVVAALQPPAHNIVHHRNVVGDYRDANDYTAAVDALYGPAPSCIGVLGQALILLDRRPHGAATAS